MSKIQDLAFKHFSELGMDRGISKEITDKNYQTIQNYYKEQQIKLKAIISSLQSEVKQIQSDKKDILKGNKEEGLHFKEPLKKFGLFVIQPFQLFLAVCIYLMVYFFTQYFGINDFTNYFYVIVIFTYLILGILHYLITWKKKFYYIDKNFSIIFLLYQIANPLHITANERFISSVIFNSILLFVFFAFLRFYYLEMKSFKQKNQFLFQ